MEDGFWTVFKTEIGLETRLLRVPLNTIEIGKILRTVVSATGETETIDLIDSTVIP